MTAQEQSEVTRQVILRMEAALGNGSNDMEAHFHPDFRWAGNRGCGTKIGLQAFRENWQLPLRTAFTDRGYETERLMYLFTACSAACSRVLSGRTAFRHGRANLPRAAFALRASNDAVNRYTVHLRGEWASCFGHIEGTHSGVFMGIESTGKRARIPYMVFWQVQGGLIVDKRVSVDFASVMTQLGTDPFNGQGWEAFDEGSTAPPRPA